MSLKMVIGNFAHPEKLKERPCLQDKLRLTAL